MKELAILSVYVTMLQKARDVTPADEVTGHRKVRPVRCDGGLLLE